VGELGLGQGLAEARHSHRSAPVSGWREVWTILRNSTKPSSRRMR
jgi:hypothetical protein